MVTLEHCRRRLGPDVVFYCEQFHLPPGARRALWGPSGCGKTTMLNLIAGLLRPDSGSVVVDGLALQDLSEGRLDQFRGERLGFIFQTFNLLGPFTALQNVLLGMRFSDTVPSRDWKPRAQELLRRVGLEHRIHHKPGALSVGEQQRVAIARALANEQRLIVADEPTGSLDPKTAESVMRLLLALCEEHGVSLLMVTHDKALADRLPETFDCSNLIIDEEAE